MIKQLQATAEYRPLQKHTTEHKHSWPRGLCIRYATFYCAKCVGSNSTWDKILCDPLIVVLNLGVLCVTGYSHSEGVVLTKRRKLNYYFEMWLFIMVMPTFEDTRVRLHMPTFHTFNIWSPSAGHDWLLWIVGGTKG